MSGVLVQHACKSENSVAEKVVNIFWEPSGLSVSGYGEAPLRSFVVIQNINSVGGKRNGEKMC